MLLINPYLSQSHIFKIKPIRKVAKKSQLFFKQKDYSKSKQPIIIKRESV